MRRSWLAALSLIACGEVQPLGGDDQHASPDGGTSESPDDGATEADEGGEDGGSGGASGASAADMGEQIPPSTLPFQDCTAECGVTMQHSALVNHFAVPGQAWGDIDRDGWLDLVLTSQLELNRVFLGGPDGQFTEPAWSKDIALVDHVSSGAVFVDYDNDGWLDLYLLAMGPNTLLRNLEGQGFADVTVQAGLGDAGVGETAAWGDFDGDGWLDVYVANNDIFSPDPLYRNLGDGSFEDVSHLLALELRGRPAFAASFFDYDLDLDLDLYLVTDKQIGTVLWRNDGPGCGGWCFTDVSAESGAEVTPFGMGLAVGDYDNDGDQDLFITDIGPMILLQNQAAQGQPTFIEVSEQANAIIDYNGWGEVGWGAQFLDFDNDGCLDLYVPLGNQDPGPELPNVLLRNRCDGTFEDVPEVGGAADSRFSFGLAVADHDNDGWLDLLVGNAGLDYALYCNRGALASGPRHHLTIELRAEGAPFNPNAVGARVRLLDDSGRMQTRQIIAGSGLGAGTSLRAHFGLGDTLPLAAIVTWPDGSIDHRPAAIVDGLWQIDHGN